MEHKMIRFLFGSDNFASPMRSYYNGIGEFL